MTSKLRSIIGTALFLLVGLSGLPAFAVGVIQLPQTGQAKCYDPSTNAEISCTSASAVGQDGYSRAGVAWPNPRFTNTDGSTPINTNIVLDRLTGLEWPVYADTPTFLSCNGGRTYWPNDLDYIACLNSKNYLGHNDWRLPNIMELVSLMNFGEPDPAFWLNSIGFMNVQSFPYGSSTHSVSTPVASWLAWFHQSQMSSYSAMTANVWPVRGGEGGAIHLPRTGQTTCYDINTNDPTSCSTTSGQDGNVRNGIVWPNPRFTGSNGTVTDNLTGLIWLRNADCAGTAMNWATALSWVDNLKSGQCGLNDGSVPGEWRLPNVTELLSLMDFEYNQPPISATDGTSQLTNLGDPFINVQMANAYSTSTTDAADPTVYMRFWAGNDGGYDRSKKTNPLFVWPVFDNRKRLYVSLSGTGSGTLTPDCTAGCWYQKNSTASLTAIPNSGSYFVWWTAGCSGLNALTTTIMDAPKTCNAVFSSCVSAPIRNIQSGYNFTAAQGLNAAYNDDFTSFFGRTDTLALLMTTLTGNVVFNLNKNIVLQGGWDCGHGVKWTSPAFIDGTITISGGSVVFDNIVIL